MGDITQSATIEASHDTRSVLANEGRVRAFHAELRSSYYPGLFGGEPFDKRLLAEPPQYAP